MCSGSAMALAGRAASGRSGEPSPLRPLVGPVRARSQPLPGSGMDPHADSVAPGVAFHGVWTTQRRPLLRRHVEQRGAGGADERGQDEQGARGVDGRGRGAGPLLRPGRRHGAVRPGARRRGGPGAGPERGARLCLAEFDLAAGRPAVPLRLQPRRLHGPQPGGPDRALRHPGPGALPGRRPRPGRDRAGRHERLPPPGRR